MEKKEKRFNLVLGQIYYKVDGFARFSEEDIYSDGCQPGITNQQSIIKDFFQSNTLSGLVGQIAECFQVEKEDILLNSCGEIGRLDVQRLETYRGRKANKEEIDLWVKGEARLYLATYIFRVETMKAEQTVIYKRQGAPDLTIVREVPHLLSGG